MSEQIIYTYVVQSLIPITDWTSVEDITFSTQVLGEYSDFNVTGITITEGK